MADDDFSFTVFPNETPGALLCLQTLTHQANVLLIVLHALIHSSVF